jgi:hypothetical protein
LSTSVTEDLWAIYQQLADVERGVTDIAVRGEIVPIGSGELDFEGNPGVV